MGGLSEEGGPASSLLFIFADTEEAFGGFRFLRSTDKARLALSPPGADGTLSIHLDVYGTYSNGTYSNGPFS